MSTRSGKILSVKICLQASNTFTAHLQLSRAEKMPPTMLPLRSQPRSSWQPMLKRRNLATLPPTSPKFFIRFSIRTSTERRHSCLVTRFPTTLHRPACAYDGLHFTGVSSSLDVF